MKITSMMIRPRKMKTMMMKRQTCWMAKKVSKISCEKQHFSFGWPIRYEESISCKVEKVKCSVELVIFCVKPWPNGVASRDKLKTWVCLRLRLARTCVHLCWLAMICPHFGRDIILHASQSKFFTVWPANPSQRKLIGVHLPIISQWNRG